MFAVHLDNIAALVRQIQLLVVFSAPKHQSVILTHKECNGGELVPTDSNSKEGKQ
jgi:hypothetical protein